MSNLVTMRNPTIPLALSLLLLTTGGPALAAKDGLVLCNRNPEITLKTAVVFYSGNALNRSWTSMGWFTVEPRKCEQILAGTNMANNNYYLSVISIGRDGRAMIYMPAETPVEEVFCVRELGRFSRGFTLKRPRLADLQDCPTGYSLQLFNIYLESKEFQRYTLSLD